MTLDEALSMLEADMDSCAAEPYVRLAADYLRTSADSVAAKPVPRDPEELARLVASPPPQQGRPIEDVLAQVATDFVPNCNWLYHPRYMGHQLSAPLPAAVWAEVIISALNQSLAVQEMSPVFTGLETSLVRWMAGLAGFGSAAGGVFTSGGTEATFTALLAARAAALPDAWETGVGNSAAVIVTGEHAHYSVARASAELGLGSRNCIALPRSSFKEQPARLAKELDRLSAEGRTVVAVVATAGSTTTGGFDDLEAVGSLCAERSIWLHVDGCHGASALLSARHRNRLCGMERATSLSWDPHKMMLLPLATSAVIVRDERLLESAFAQRAPYLFHAGRGGRVLDQGLRSFQCSRRADAVKLWIALQRYGTEVFGLLYDRLCATAAGIAEAVMRRSDFECCSQPESNILCFRYVGDRSRTDPELDGLNSRLRKELNSTGTGWITLARLDGRQVLRITVMNPRTRPEDGEAVLVTIARLAANGC